MRPRTRRRLTWAGGAVAAAVAIGAAFHVVRSDGSSASHDSGSARESPVGDQSLGVAYGDSATRVNAKVGSPTTKRGSCWVYSAKAHTVHGAYLGDFVDGVRYCFGAGPAGGIAVTAIEVHVIPHTLLNKKWYPGGWNTATTVLPAPPPAS